jgi:hypothetical protein
VKEFQVTVYDVERTPFGLKHGEPYVERYAGSYAEGLGVWRDEVSRWTDYVKAEVERSGRARLHGSGWDAVDVRLAAWDGRYWQTVALSDIVWSRR